MRAMLPLAGSRRVLPEDAPTVYLRHLTAEELVEKRERGGLVARWQLKQGRTDNHRLDTTYINATGAIALGGRDLKAEHKARLWALANTESPPAPSPGPAAAPRSRPTDQAPASSLGVLYGGGEARG